MRTVSRWTAFRLFLALTLVLVACQTKEEPKVACGGLAGKPCPQGQFCDLPAGQCQGADLEGLCAVRPESCNQRIEPVCGCDGKSYSNDCMRQMAGVQKDHDGECRKAG